jgi:hypothetical protein
MLTWRINFIDSKIREQYDEDKGTTQLIPYIKDFADLEPELLHQEAQ